MPSPATVLVTLAALLTGCATTSNPLPPRPGTEVPPGQDVKLVAYNVALGAVAGGLGALVNGSEDGPWRRLARGAGWGAVGGSVAYVGKWQAGEIAENERIAYALPARLVHGAGVSITENAAHDRPPLDRLAAHVGPVRLDVRPRSGRVRVRLLPVAALAFGVLVFDEDSDLDLGRSVAFGSPLFMADSIDPPLFGEAGRFSGYAFLGSLIVRRQSEGFNYPVLGHELVHLMQMDEMGRVEASFRAPADASLRRSPLYRGLARWVYLDSPALMAVAYYGIEGGVSDRPCYYDNWLEREAEAFGERRPVETCR